MAISARECPKKRKKHPMAESPPTTPSAYVYASNCPFCHTAVPAEATVCSGCQAVKGATGGRSPDARKFIALGWIFVAIGIIFGFGALMFAPWTGNHRGVMDLPLVGYVHLSLGVGGQEQCRQTVTYRGRVSERVVIDGGPCFGNEHQLRMQERFHDMVSVYGEPYTVRPSDQQVRLKALTVSVVSWSICIGSFITMVLCLWWTTGVVARLQNPPLTPAWLR
jgi:hypothetical protein